MAQLLLNRDADIEAVNLAETPLHIAAEQRNLDGAKPIVDRGANIHAINKIGNTPIMSLMTKIDNFDYDWIAESLEENLRKRGEETLVLNLIDGDTKIYRAKESE